MITYTANVGMGLGLPAATGSDDDGAGNTGAATWQPCSLPVEGEPTTAEGQTVVDKDEWPAGWLGRVFGCLSDAGLERQPQGDYEERDRLD
jgi:hypothetical protein